MDHQEGKGTAASEDPPGSRPRAMVHRKILDVADANPNASLDAVAEEVSGASVTFVERVLEEYGDPAVNGGQPRRSDGFGRDRGSDGPDAKTNGVHDEASHSEAPDEGTETTTDGTERGETGQSAVNESVADVTDDHTGNGSDSGPERVTDPSELTEKQYETLVAVHERPGATQEEIGAELNVSRATVSKRLSDVPGFEWATRRQFVDQLFETRGGGGATVTEQQSGVEPGRVEAIAERLDEIEAKLDDGRLVESREPADPDLVHKVVHACMDAEYVSREEELEILRSVLPSDHSADDIE